MTNPTAATSWPDVLHAAEAPRLQQVLDAWWGELGGLADLLARGELILAEECISRLRAGVIEMMLGMNGIARPEHTRSLNGYLGESQRNALEHTLNATGGPRASLIARAVALTVITRWYAPQLVDRFTLIPPTAAEADTLRTLTTLVPEWPITITTD